MQCGFQGRLVYFTWGDVRKMSLWLYTRPMFEVFNVILVHAPLWELPILSARDAIMESNRLNLESEGAPSISGPLKPTQTLLAPLSSQSPVIQKGKSANSALSHREGGLWSVVEVAPSRFSELCSDKLPSNSQRISLLFLLVDDQEMLLDVCKRCWMF